MKRKEDYGLEKVFGERLFQEMYDQGKMVEDFEEDDICSASVLNSYISGKTLPQLRTAVRIADYLGVGLDYLCGMDNVSDIVDHSEIVGDNAFIPWGRLES